MKPALLLDLDGVLVNFVRGAHLAHGREPVARVEWNFFEPWGMTPVEFWAPMGFDFWLNLTWTDEGRELLRGLEGLIPSDRIALLTSPCDTRGGVEGKVEWVRRHMPDYRRRLLVGPPKYLMAGPGKVLVDDHEPNVDGFLGEGGRAVLVPRSWNRRADEACPTTNTFSVQAVLAEVERELRAAEKTLRGD